MVRQVGPSPLSIEAGSPDFVVFRFFIGDHIRVRCGPYGLLTRTRVSLHTDHGFYEGAEISLFLCCEPGVIRDVARLPQFDFERKTQSKSHVTSAEIPDCLPLHRSEEHTPALQS